MQINLRNRQWIIAEPNRDDFERLRKLLQDRRPNVLIDAAEAIAAVADAATRDELWGRALAHAGRGVSIDDAVAFSETGEGSLLLVAWRLQAAYPNEGFTEASVVNEFMAMSEAERARFIDREPATTDIAPSPTESASISQR